MCNRDAATSVTGTQNKEEHFATLLSDLIGAVIHCSQNPDDERATAPACLGERERLGECPRGNLTRPVRWCWLNCDFSAFRSKIQRALGRK
jgi:hypothetical protein